MAAPFGPPGSGWRGLPKGNQAPPNATRARPSTTTLDQFLKRQPATQPQPAQQQQAATAEQVNNYLASLGLPPVPPGVDPMSALMMSMQSAMMAPPPFPPPFDPWAGYVDPWAAGAFYDPYAAYYAPSPDAPLAQWEAEAIYTSQPSAWSAAYGGGA